MTNKKRAAGICALAMLALAVPVSASPLVGDLSLLTTTADGAEAALLKLHTWSGTATVTASEKSAAGPGQRSVTTVDFICDCGHDAVRWKCNVQDVSGDMRGDARISMGMLHDNKIYQLQPFVADEPRPNNLTLKITARPSDPQLAVQRVYDEFSPMQYYPQMNVNTARTLRWYKKHANDPELIGGTIRQNGDAIILETSGEEAINRYTFDRSQGFAITAFMLKDAHVEEDCAVTYESISGVIVPRSYQYIHRVKRTGIQGMVEDFRIEVAYEKSRVNSVLGPDVFDMSPFDLRKGDTIDDRISGLSYDYVPGPAKPAARQP